jgi:hypothetical protein
MNIILARNHGHFIGSEKGKRYPDTDIPEGANGPPKKRHEESHQSPTNEDDAPEEYDQEGVIEGDDAQPPIEEDNQEEGDDAQPLIEEDNQEEGDDAYPNDDSEEKGIDWALQVVPEKQRETYYTNALYSIRNRERILEFLKAKKGSTLAIKDIDEDIAKRIRSFLPMEVPYANICCPWDEQKVSF